MPLRKEDPQYSLREATKTNRRAVQLSNLRASGLLLNWVSQTAARRRSTLNHYNFSSTLRIFHAGDQQKMLTKIAKNMGHCQF
jgi:hypothetical protein